jgi:c-di-GMP-binding flagellar brake protein YcgR
MPNQLFISGIPASLELPRVKSNKFNTIFLGCKEGEYVFLDFPPSQTGQYIPLEENEPCIIRFVKEGKVYGFQSFIEKVIKSPLPFLLIKYPESIDQINLRSAIRYHVQLETFLSSHPSDSNVEDRFKGFIIDISEGGCLVKTIDSFPINTSLFLSFSLPETGEIKNLETRIARIYKKEEGHEIGLCFSNFEDPNHQQIRKYLDRIDKLQIIN